jgi:hypothetical protein
VLWSKGEALEVFEYALVIWIGQVNVKNGTTDGVIKEEVKVLGQ